MILFNISTKGLILMDYLDYKKINSLDNYYDDNILELRKLSKSDFNKLIKTIENTVKELKENN
ncbi:hypothetical protein [Paratissierella segnis]|nr:hypothetical protein [Paratissierella segnis]